MRQVLVDNEDGRLVADVIQGKVFFHVKFWKWSASKYKEYSKVFDTYLKKLKELGHKVVFACPYEADLRAQKLIKMFGFREVSRHGGLVVLIRRLEN